MGVHGLMKRVGGGVSLYLASRDHYLGHVTFAKDCKTIQ